MLLTEFFKNPMGKGSTALNIKATQADFDKRYDKFYKKITHKAFFIKEDIYVSINIPSSVDGIFYDVVLKFTPNQKSAGVSVIDMDFQVFSNSPSFLYTYANAYYKKRMLIKELNRKLSREMIKEIATVKNPYSIISYDITVYSAIKYLLTTGFDKIESLKIDSVQTNTLTPLLKTVQDWDTLQKNRRLQKDINKRQAEEEKQEKIKYKSESNDKNDDVIAENKKVKKVKNSISSKKSSKIKKIKKVKK